jgi:hypothetical protein
MVTAAKCYELEAWKIGSGEHKGIKRADFFNGKAGSRGLSI